MKPWLLLLDFFSVVHCLQYGGEAGKGLQGQWSLSGVSGNEVHHVESELVANYGRNLDHMGIKSICVWAHFGVHVAVQHYIPHSPSSSQLWTPSCRPCKLSPPHQGPSRARPCTRCALHHTPPYAPACLRVTPLPEAAPWFNLRRKYRFELDHQSLVLWWESLPKYGEGLSSPSHTPLEFTV